METYSTRVLLQPNAEIGRLGARCFCLIGTRDVFRRICRVPINCLDTCAEIAGVGRLSRLFQENHRFGDDGSGFTTETVGMAMMMLRLKIGAGEDAHAVKILSILAMQVDLLARRLEEEEGERVLIVLPERYLRPCVPNSARTKRGKVCLTLFIFGSKFSLFHRA